MARTPAIIRALKTARNPNIDRALFSRTGLVAYINKKPREPDMLPNRGGES